MTTTRLHKRLAEHSHSSTGPVYDRLTTTLFLTGLLHAVVIIGVNFVTPPIPPEPIAPTLDVVMLTNQADNESAHPDAAYLAQRNQSGSGNTKSLAPATSPIASPVAAIQKGTASGDALRDSESVQGEQVPEILSSPTMRAEITYLGGTTTPAYNDATPLELTPIPPNPIVTSHIDDTLQLRGENSRELYITPDTRESRLAPYIDSWRRKIETIGTLHYPLTGHHNQRAHNPVLEVIIDADGNLINATVRHSSGDPTIDQAALNILKLAAPFDPFPTTLHSDYDQLRFAYEWQFIE